jgi:ABC-2 type transport system ATP-binding protein
LVDPRPGIEDALNLPFVKKIERIDEALVVSLNDPERENPLLVKRLVELGVGIRYVNELRMSLEDLYLDLMEDDDAPA